jgi:hypothetical protein
MNLPTFRIRDSGGEPSDHEAVHIVYVRELWAENERLREALKWAEAYVPKRDCETRRMIESLLPNDQDQRRGRAGRASPLTLTL